VIAAPSPRQAAQRIHEAGADRLGVVASRQVDQAHISAGAVDHGADRGLAGPADDQVFLVTDPQPQLSIGRPVVNQPDGAT
jgi:hypothetical protein